MFDQLFNDINHPTHHGLGHVLRRQEVRVMAIIHGVPRLCCGVPGFQRWPSAEYGQNACVMGKTESIYMQALLACDVGEC